MPRPRERVCLQDGLKLDLNDLAKKGFIRRGFLTGGRGIRWTHPYWDEVARGSVSADLSGETIGWLRIRIGNLDQRIMLTSKVRHYGGRQWYFVCPEMNRLASVLWLPSGATRFCSRQTWGRRVAYQSQFSTPDGRAHLGQAKIKSRLIGDLDPDEWSLPPKPKGMRWSTYTRYDKKFDRYETILDGGINSLLTRLGKL